MKAVGDLRAELEIIAKARVRDGATADTARHSLCGSAQFRYCSRRFYSALLRELQLEFKAAPPASIGRFSIVLPEGQNFTRTRSQVAAISPTVQCWYTPRTGSFICDGWRNWRRSLIPGTQEDVSSHSFHRTVLDWLLLIPGSRH